MIQITITPACGMEGGVYRATGHAGNDLICNTVTAIEECLAANLHGTWNIRTVRNAEKGSYVLSWSKTDKKGAGIQRANMAAGFAYNGLKALAAEYPENVQVRWNKAAPVRRFNKEGAK